jgi:hypothetical protein
MLRSAVMVELRLSLDDALMQRLRKKSGGKTDYC